MNSGAAKEYRIKEGFSWIEPLIVKWLDINLDYINDHGVEDCMYWYNERANVSSFAGAVWRCGGLALEEYSAEKGWGEGVKDKLPDNKYKGRVDLYFSFSEYGVISEAKMGWLNVESEDPKCFKKYIDSRVADADNALKCTLKENMADFGLSLTFVAPYYNVKSDVTESMAHFDRVIRETECSFYALFKNTSGHDIVTKKEQVYNTIAMIGKLTKL